MNDPQKVCPQCRQVQPLSAAFCVNCGRQFRSTAPQRKPFPWVPVLLLAVPLLLCSPCLLSWGWVAVSSTVQQPEPDISKVRLFMTRKQVKDTLGEPDSVQTFQRPGGEEVYWYYGRHQLVFEMNWLRSINSY